MLQSLSIKNVALIKNIVIDFNKGLNILLGETGAGKSIIFDALNFVLGAKADKTLIRSGEESMRVDAVFTNLSESCMQALAEYGIEEDEVLLSRTFSFDGKSSIRINGNPSTQMILKEIGKSLVDSYSQHESVELLKSKSHLTMLDKFGKSQIDILKQEVKEKYNEYNSIIKEIDHLGGDEFEREREISLLTYQIKEIEDANLKTGEEEEIHDRLRFLNNAEKIFQAISLCEEYLDGSSTSCINSLQQVSNQLTSLTNFDKLSDCKNRIDSVRYEIEDINQTLLDIKAETDFDENEFERLDRRYDLIKSLEKKYGGSIENVLNYLNDIKYRLDELNDSEQNILKLNKEKEKVYNELLIKSEELSNMRKSIAKDIEIKILTELKELGMKSSKFEVKFTKLNDFTSNGIDGVEFVFSANKGQEVKALSKIASGGELSRFMLALKNIFAEIGSAQTLIFDEIDSGISGETGKIVGEKLKNLTSFAQVICITHLPQVACFGDHFYYVSKYENENETMTSIKLLKDDEIPYNIAKMIVGDNVSDIALSQAKEMLSKVK